MRGIEDDSQPLHLAEQLLPLGIERRACIGAMGIPPRPVMPGAHCPQAIAIRPLEMRKRDTRICPLEREDIADRQSRRVGPGIERPLPARHMRVEPRGIDDLDEFPRLLHRPIPSELPLRLGPGLLGRMPPRQRIVGRHKPADLRGNDEAESPPTQLRERHRRISPVGLVGPPPRPLPGIDLPHGQAEIAIPFERVHREIEMGIDGEHVQRPRRGGRKSLWGHGASGTRNPMPKDGGVARAPKRAEPASGARDGMSDAIVIPTAKARGHRRAPPPTRSSPSLSRS